MSVYCDRDKLFHLEVEDQIGIGIRVRRPLCLNGSAHAKRTDDENRVNCPRCKAIKGFEVSGLTRQAARHEVYEHLEKYPMP
jgi:hypothetical protein